MPREINEAGLAIVKSFEGLRLNAYNDAVGIKTIGYGHVVKPNESLDTITEAQAVELLRADLQIAESAVMRLITTTLNDNQFAALVSFTFNLGAGSLQRSTLRMCLNRMDYASAADEFGKWVFAGGQKLAGLVRRRAAERTLFLMAVQDIDLQNPEPVDLAHEPALPQITVPPAQVPSDTSSQSTTIPQPQHPTEPIPERHPVGQDKVSVPVVPPSVSATPTIVVPADMLAPLTGSLLTRLWRWLFRSLT